MTLTPTLTPDPSPSPSHNPNPKPNPNPNPWQERLKLLSKVENLKDLGSAFGFASKYNGKPALITKSGNISQVRPL